MPRNHLDRKRYKLEDFKMWVIGQMKRKHMTQADLGSVLGISQQRMSAMLKIPKNEKEKREKRINDDPFSYGQILTLFECFGTDEKEKNRLLTM